MRISNCYHSVLLFLSFLFCIGSTQAQRFDWLELGAGNANKSISGMEKHDEFIYVAGTFMHTLTLGNTTVNSPNIDNAFVAKYDTLGNLHWLKKYGSNIANNHTRLSSMSVDDSGNVYIAGNYFNSLTFGSDTLSGNWSCFIASINSDGLERWAKNLSGQRISPIVPFEVPTMESDGKSLFVFGSYSDSLFYDNNFISYGTADCFLLKIDSNGSLLWDKNIGHTSQLNEQSKAVDIKVSNNKIYITGSYSGEFRIDTFSVISSSPSTTYSDIFIAKLDSIGNPIG